MKFQERILKDGRYPISTAEFEVIRKGYTEVDKDSLGPTLNIAEQTARGIRILKPRRI